MYPCLVWFLGENGVLHVESSRKSAPHRFAEPHALLQCGPRRCTTLGGLRGGVISPTRRCWCAAGPRRLACEIARLAEASGPQIALPRRTAIHIASYAARVRREHCSTVRTVARCAESLPLSAGPLGRDVAATRYIVRKRRRMLPAIALALFASSQPAFALNNSKRTMDFPET